jgi:hypothetical protein
MDDDQQTREPLPRLGYPKLVALTGQLQSVITRYSSAELTSDMVFRMSELLHELVGVGRKSTIVDSLLPYCGPFDAGKAKLVAMQLAGRKDELRRGPLTPYQIPTYDQWVPVEITHVAYGVWRDDKPGADIKMLALAFQPAGHQLFRKFPSSILRFLAYRVGFSRRTRYDDEVLHFTGFRLWVHVKCAVEGSPRLEIDAWEVSPWMMKHNKAIITLRTRFDVEDGPACPVDATDPCWGCKEPLSVCPASMIR